MLDGRIESLGRDAVVVLYLIQPAEKYWGLLQSLTPVGITLRAINLSAFEDWVHSILHEPEPSLGLATIFFPLARVERMFLDEQVGQVESLCQIFERRVGKTVEAYLSLRPDEEEPTH